MTTLDAPPVFHLAERDGSRFTLRAENGAVVHLFVLEPEIIRVLLAPTGELTMPRTWAIAPGQADVALEGRERLPGKEPVVNPVDLVASSRARRTGHDIVIVRDARLGAQRLDHAVLADTRRSGHDHQDRARCTVSV